jgi:hypothetical protein
MGGTPMQYINNIIKWMNMQEKEVTKNNQIACDNFVAMKTAPTAVQALQNVDTAAHNT